MVQGMKSLNGKTVVYIGMHALTAGVFGFVLQRFALSAEVQTSLIWAGAFRGAAGVLAWQPTQR
mgnify:CR=1 FL=1